ncbi:hypothetical protein KPSA1_00922 [Pseudomonas syringae pv. actinidiae]|uniref:Uncharacterized protein n=1 Tax=Pseudomonas syringae pv. actinidiae TaxID=103796 RepID=A0A2V0QEF5_PSESF|nr:hypothetical protein KPSA1_00922 [Pseudomonas syringae pv. actinidiae]
MRVSKSVIGVDVAKIELVTYQADSDLLALIPNEKPAIKRSHVLRTEAGS